MNRDSEITVTMVACSCIFQTLMNARQTRVSMAQHASTDLADISVAVQLDLLDIIVIDVCAF